MSTNISTAPCRPKQNSHWDFPGFWRSHNRFKFEGSDLETWKGHWESNGKCLASLPCTQRPVTVWLGKIRVTCSHWWTHQLLKWMGLRQRSLEMIRVETGVGTPWLRPWIRSHGDHGHIHSLPTANRYSMQHCILSLLSCSVQWAIPWTPEGNHVRSVDQQGNCRPVLFHTPERQEGPLPTACPLPCRCRSLLGLLR